LFINKKKYILFINRMQNKNFTIIEDIFDTDNTEQVFSNDYISQKSFSRTLDNSSLHNSYPTGNIPVLSYDEEMIKRKFNRQHAPRSVSNQYNSLNSSNRILQPPPSQEISQVQVNNTRNPSQQSFGTNVPQTVGGNIQNQSLHISCRNIYEHIENCPMCSKYYKQSNRIYILIIIFLILIILLLLRQQK